MICPICKKNVKDGAIYCTSCGFELEKKYYCPYCGTKNFRGNTCELCGVGYDEYIEYAEKGPEKENEPIKKLTEEEQLAPFEYVKKATGTYAITGLADKSVLKVEIPSFVDEIKEKAFQDTGLIEVRLNEGLLKIGKYAFYNCENLMSVNIPNSVVFVGECAFLNCPLCVVIPKPSVKIIGDYAFGDWNTCLEDDKVVLGFYPQEKKDPKVVILEESNPAYCDGDDGNIYQKINDQYYKWSPVTWSVCEEMDNKKVLVCDSWLDVCTVNDIDKEHWLNECFEKMFTKEQKSHITELRFIDKKELEFLKGRKIKYTNYGVRISYTSRYILNEKSIIENFKAYHNVADRDTLLELRFEGSFAGMCLPVVVIDK